MFDKWRKQRRCFHHNQNTGESWIQSTLINNGSGKQFWCTVCGRNWFV